VLGGGDNTLYEGPLKRVPFLPPYVAYYVELKGITLGGQDIMNGGGGSGSGGNVLAVQQKRKGLRGLTGGNGTTTTSSSTAIANRYPISVDHRVLIDTGNSQLYLNQPTFLAFKDTLLKTIPTLASSPQLFQKKPTILSHDTIEAMPDLVFYLDQDVVITLHPDDYLNKVSDKNGVEYNILRMTTRGGFTFGQTVLNK